VTPRRLAGIALVCAATACAPKKVVSPDPAIAAQASLGRADALVRVGCFDCLAEALNQYQSLLAIPAARAGATAGAIRASALLAVRERELGTTDSGYLEKARDLAAVAAGTGVVHEDVTPLLDIVALLPWRAGAGRSGAPDQPQSIYQDRDRRVAMLSPLASRDELSAYVWLAYACETSFGRTEKSELIAPIDERSSSPLSSLPLLAFKLAICRGVDSTSVETLFEREPRFAELSFFRGLNASGLRKLDDADARYREAYRWRATWPAATFAIGNLAMTSEEFASALEFYNTTLELAPSYPDALLGKLRALTYLARHEDALGVAGELLALSRYPGDAYYWRAFNELQLGRLDAAWDDVESSDKVMVNSDVPKLAGIIELRRRDLEVARQKLQLSRQRNPSDCESGYYLHLVLADLVRWPDVVEAAVATAGCLDDAEAFARSEIERIADSPEPEGRKARQIARREQQIVLAARMRATCFFNAAVAYFNLAKPAEARRYAEKLAGDEQFGKRARELMGRIAP
jgi:tetratricopeptide (TPR) repeat protein